ncbi:MAG: M15 family metallopeptidase [Eubacteriales bacterium]
MKERSEETIQQSNMVCRKFSLGRVCKKAIGFLRYITNVMKAYVIDNFKRYSAVCATIVLFMLTCSFALPSSMGVVNNATFSLSGSGEVVLEEDQELMQQITRVNESLVDIDIEFNEVNQSTEIAKNAEVYSLDDIMESANRGEEQVSTEEDDSLDPNSWNLILINKQHPVPVGYEVKLATIKDSMKCDVRILPHLLDMLQAAKEESNINLIVCSPYRDYERQAYLFEQKMLSFIKEDFSYFEAYQLSSQTVTVPGASEHQIGIAVDFITSDYMSLDTGFADTVGGEWLAKNAHRFGFILRYPLGKEYITGIQFEPWHYRYVGKTAATMMYEQDITLEEFIEGL